MPDAYYLPSGDERYRPTEATTSPWDSTAQHGGPPSALLATAMQRLVPDRRCVWPASPSSSSAPCPGAS